MPSFSKHYNLSIALGGYFYKDDSVLSIFILSQISKTMNSLLSLLWLSMMALQKILEENKPIDTSNQDNMTNIKKKLTMHLKNINVARNSCKFFQWEVFCQEEDTIWS